MADVAMDSSSLIEPAFTDLELEHPVEGDITIPGAQDEEGDPSTLDEPVIDTIMRDASAVGKKFLHVMYPRKSRSLLKDWDLWGPLILCTLMAVLLHIGLSNNDSSADDKAGTQEMVGFSQVFSLLAFGAVTVAVNSKLLGGTISFFQSVCVLGYCILPLVLSLIIGMSIHLVTETSNSFILLGIRVLLTLVACVWSTLASVAFLADSQPQHRRVLAVYPVCLFYFVISWMVLTGE